MRLFGLGPQEKQQVACKNWSGVGGFVSVIEARCRHRPSSYTETHNKGAGSIGVAAISEKSGAARREDMRIASFSGE